MNRQLVAVGVAAALAGLPQVALAQGCEDCPAAATFGAASEWNVAYYAGASFQHSRFKEWDVLAHVDVASYTSRSIEERDAGFRLTAGMDFMELFGVEFTYADFGEASFTGQTDGSGAVFAPGTQRETMKLDAYGLHLLARAPLARDFSFFGKAGWWSFSVDQRQEGVLYDPGPTPYSLSASNSAIRFGWGAGFDYDGFKPVRMAFTYEFASFEAPFTAPTYGVSEVSSVTLTLKYIF